MTTPFRVTLRVTGHGRLADFGERVRWLMVRDIDAQSYSEHRAEGMSRPGDRFPTPQCNPFGDLATRGAPYANETSR